MPATPGVDYSPVKDNSAVCSVVKGKQPLWPPFYAILHKYLTPEIVQFYRPTRSPISVDTINNNNNDSATVQVLTHV